MLLLLLIINSLFLNNTIQSVLFNSYLVLFLQNHRSILINYQTGYYREKRTSRPGRTRLEYSQTSRVMIEARKSADGQPVSEQKQRIFNLPDLDFQKQFRISVLILIQIHYRNCTYLKVVFDRHSSGTARHNKRFISLFLICVCVG